MFFKICIRNYTENISTFIKIIWFLDMKFKLEICSGSVESAVNAQLAGADPGKIINIINILKMI
jgi:hypothetical protein